jgi:hypothetical protein
MKTIIVQWFPVNDNESEMRVIKSTHERFTEGTRFDFGFLKIATEQGYTIISLPFEKK